MYSSIWLDNIRLASRLDDAKAKYPDFSDQIDQMAAADLSGNQKYLMWMAGQLARNEPLDEIISLVQTFHQRAQALPQKDINAYATLGDLRGAIESIPSKSKSKQEREVKESEARKVYEDDRYAVIYPKTTGASCVYGKGTQWCISATESENYFAQYSDENKHFYFIIDKKLRPDDPHSKIAIVMNEIGEVEDVFDAEDNRIDLDDVRAWPVVRDAIMEASEQQGPDNDFNLAQRSSDISLLDDLAGRSDEQIRVNIAFNRNTPEEILIRLADDPSEKVRMQVAERNDLTSDILDVLSSDEQYKVRRHVSRDPRTSQEALERLSRDKDDEVRENVAYNPFTSYSVMTQLSSDEAPVIRRGVASNRHAPPELLSKLSEDHDVEVREAVARNRATPGDVLTSLSDNPYMRPFVAKNPSTPPETLSEISSTSDYVVRVYVAQNPSTPTETLVRLSTDEVRFVGVVAKQNLDSRHPSTKQSSLWYHNIHTASRLDDVKAKYPALSEQIDQMAAQDPSGNQKYLMWMAGQLNKGEPLDEIISLTQTFHERAAKLPQKDINSYVTLGDLRGAIEAVPVTKSKSQQEKETKSTEADKIYEDDNYAVIYPKTTGASCVYGKGTQWCISATESTNYFSQYSEDNNHFYFIIDKTLEPTDPHSKIAVVIQDGVRITDVFDANDKRIDIDDVNAWPVVQEAVMSAAGQRKDTAHYTAKMTDDPVALSQLALSSEPGVRRSVARNPNTPPETLAALSSDQSRNVRADVIRNPNTPAKTLASFASDNDVAVRTILADNTSAPPEALKALASDKDAGIRLSVARNPGTSSDVLFRLSSDAHAAVRMNVAQNPNSPLDALVGLSSDTNQDIREGIARNPATPSNILTNLLASDGRPSMRKSIARNPNTPSEILNGLASHEDDMTRHYVGGNPNTPAQALSVLASDMEDYVRSSVARNPSTPMESLADLSFDEQSQIRSFIAENPNTPATSLAKLSSDEIYRVRSNVAKNPATPEDVLVFMSSSQEEVPQIAELAKQNLADRNKTASMERPSCSNTHSMWYKYNPTKESPMYKSAYSSLSEDVSNVFDLAEEAEDEVRDDDPEAYALIEDLESELHDAVSEVLQVFEDDVPEKAKKGVRISDNSDDLADLFMRDVKEAHSHQHEFDRAMSEFLVEGDICPACERAPLVKTSAAMQCVDCGCKFAAEVGTVTTRKPQRREIESSDDLELPEPQSLEMMFPDPSNSEGVKITTSGWLSLAADDEEDKDEEKPEKKKNRVDDEEEPDEGDEAESDKHEDDPDGDEHSPDFGEDSEEDDKGKDKPDFTPQHSDAQAMEMMYPGPSDSGGVAEEMQSSPAQVDREMGNMPKVDVQPTLDELKYRVEEHNSQSRELKTEVENKAQEVADMIDTMYKGLEAQRMPPPSWVPASMHPIWRTATSVYLDEQRKSIKAPDARQKVAVIYKALMDKYQPEVMGTFASLKSAGMEGFDDAPMDYLPGDEAIFESRNDVGVLPMSIDQDFGGCGCEAEPSMDELSDALHDVFEDEYMSDEPQATAQDESEDLKCRVDHHRMEGEALEKEISEIKQQVDELTELLNAPAESPYNESIDMMYPGNSYYSSGPTLGLWD